MDLTPRLQLMNWLVSQGLTGMPEHDLVRGFCERCRAEGLELSRGMVFIDTLPPIFEGPGFRWSDSQTNERDIFEYGSTAEGDALQNWRRSTFFHMLENGHDEMRIDLDRWRDSQTNERDIFEYGSTAEGDALQNWRRSTFFHMLENGHDEMRID